MASDNEAMTMLDRLVNLQDLSKEDRNSHRHERQIREVRVLNKNHISDYFMLE